MELQVVTDDEDSVQFLWMFQQLQFGGTKDSATRYYTRLASLVISKLPQKNKQFTRPFAVYKLGWASLYSQQFTSLISARFAWYY